LPHQGISVVEILIGISVHQPWRIFMIANFARITLACCAISAATVPPAVAASDPASGKVVFQSICATCHSAQPGQNKIGPSLFGVVGRPAHSVVDYSYSQANQSANLNWDPPTLDKYLEAPKAVMPGTKMAYSGLKDEEKRASLIAYLATLR
jgi:cytochrome c